jgi:2-hydroxychromene-2-carboxylate isomerase
MSHSKVLDVYLDLGNIAGLLALPGLRALQADLKPEVHYWPIQGIVPRPLSPEPGRKPDDPLAEFKQLRWQAKHQHEVNELARDCQRLQLDAALAKRQFDASLTHQAWLYLLEVRREKIADYIAAVYTARFEQGRTLTEMTEVSELLSTLQADGAAFADQQQLWQARWQQHEERYLALGIHDSPAFVLDSETFQGRQHFPLLRWRLEGESGAPPV